MRRSLFSLGLVAVVLHASGALRAEETTAKLEQALRAQRTPGASFAVVKDGEIVYSAALGVTAREGGAPVTAQTRFAIGSMGKQFTATMVALLIDEGKLSVEDPIGKYLPEIPQQYAAVTVHQLLGHLSGIPRDFKKGDSFKDKKLYKAMAKSKPDFEPGTSFAYSNTNFILLGAMVEAIAGKSLEALLQERVFDPLKMTRTVCILPEAPVEDRATGYETPDGAPLSFLPVRYGAGNQLSTAEDIARWSIGLSDETIVSRELQERMWRPELPTATYKDEQGLDTRVGYGWFVKTIGDKRIVEHSGSLDGFFGTIARHVDDGVSFVVLTNCEKTDLGALLRILEADYLPR